MNFTIGNKSQLNPFEEAEEGADMLAATKIPKMTDADALIRISRSSEQSQQLGEIEEASSASRCDMATESTPMQGERGRHVSISFNSEEDHKHSETTPLETIFTRLTDTFAAALRQVATEHTLRTNGNKAVPPPEFRGLEHESAQLFIEKIEDYFHANNITDYPTKLAIIIDQLKGEAQRWFEPYKFLITQYATFTERLRTKFDSVESITQATARLYGDKQPPGESVAVFITKKMCIFNRVDNGKPEVIKTGIVLDQLRPEIRSRLRGQHIMSLEELVTVASQIERDLQDIPHSHSSSNNTERRQQEPKRANSPVPVESYVNRNRTGPPSPCRFCPGNQWHYHSECPNRPIVTRNLPRSQNNSLSGNERNQQWRENSSIPQRNQEQYRARPPRETLRRTVEFPDESHSETQRQGNLTWTEDPAGHSSSPSVHN